VKEDGWVGADHYPPVLSMMIKFARFMLVQKAALLSPPDEDGESDRVAMDFDSGYESGGSHRAAWGSLDWVKAMTDAFMVRGTGTPIIEEKVPLGLRGRASFGRVKSENSVS